MIPLSIPNFEGNETKYVLDAVSQGWVSTGGAYITKFEKMVAEFLCEDSAVACQSGTSALHLSLIECGVLPGEFVIVPTLTFIAAVNPVRYCGADPIFIDCDDSLCMDPVKLEKFCREECVLRDKILIHKNTGKKIKAVVVVHVFGNMADMEKIMNIANSYNLKIVEDATEALGTRYIGGKYKGKFAGTIGDFGAFSFNGNKIITTGGGGMVVAKDRNALEHIRYISTQAKDDPIYYVHDEVGYNYRMTNVQAAIGVAQIEKLPEFIVRKNNNFDEYMNLLQDSKDVELLRFRQGTYANKWFYSLYIRSIDKVKSKELVENLSKNGIQARCIWDLINKQKPYTNCIAFEIERAYEYAERIVNIPCSTNLKKEDIKEVVNQLDIILRQF